MSRPLRTSAVTEPRTFGERIRYARLSTDLSQEQFANRINAIVGGSSSKSLISMWERDLIKNPQNANLLAVQAVTGMSMQWLATGKGQRRINMPVKNATQSTVALDVQALTRALATADPKLEDPARTARIVAGLYDVLCDTPDLPQSLLDRFASGLARE